MTSVVRVPYVEKGPRVGLDIGFTIVPWVGEWHGVARITSNVVVGMLYRRQCEVGLTSSPIGALNDCRVQWGEDLLTSFALLNEHGHI